jgi:hypothetical protein
MKLSVLERKILRGKIISILEGAYPHHVERDILDAALDQLNFWKGEEATLAETVYLKQRGYLDWEKDPDPADPRGEKYRYVLTAHGHELATGERRDDSIAWFEAMR